MSIETDKQRAKRLRIAYTLHKRAAAEHEDACHYRDVEGWDEAAILYQEKSAKTYRLARFTRDGFST